MLSPRMRFEGSDTARQMSRVFAENLQDLLNKVDRGGGGFPEGFLHTSTMPHEGACYYGETWSRDGGRGLVELARLGFAGEALSVARYFLDNRNHGDHWGQVFPRFDNQPYEIDGNALILLGIFHTWLANERSPELGREFLEALMPTFRWMERLMTECPYGYLLPCASEMSGNPYTPYQVYAVYPNYAALVALSGFACLAGQCGRRAEEEYLRGMEGRLAESLLRDLVSKGKGTLVPEGCWLNGLDGRDGRPYDFAEYAGKAAFPIYHWTRQLPYILACDFGGYSLAGDDFYPVHRRTYDYIHRFMSQGGFFRKYGFVSNTCWTGMSGRHDDTMCGYGQGFMTQAALLMDDINTYTKLVEGITRLAYDGDVVEPRSFEMNPWVMSECFTYENYEQGLDHTFGTMSEGRPWIMDNPGDEGNLVQEAEIIKALALVAGVENAPSGALRLMPRLPWTWDEMELRDYPIYDARGRAGRMSFRLAHERWLRSSSFMLESTIPLEDAAVRLGPFPARIRIPDDPHLRLEASPGGSWVWVGGLSGSRIEREIRLLG